MTLDSVVCVNDILYLNHRMGKGQVKLIMHEPPLGYTPKILIVNHTQRDTNKKKSQAKRSVSQGKAQIFMWFGHRTYVHRKKNIDCLFSLFSPLPFSFRPLWE